MTLYVVKVDGYPRTFRNFKRATWALSFYRIGQPFSRITFKRVTLPKLGGL